MTPRERRYHKNREAYRAVDLISFNRFGEVEYHELCTMYRTERLKNLMSEAHRIVGNHHQ